MTLLICLSAAVIIVFVGWLLHHFPIPSKPKEIARVITMPPSTVAKEYGVLRDRIMNASTRPELSVLESQAIEFYTDFGEAVRDMYDDLVQELNIRNHVLHAKKTKVLHR